MWARVQGCGLAQEPGSQLRAILEPTRASRLAGDFRSGKRLAIIKRRRKRNNLSTLPAGLAGELAEQLRAILEPTRASRLAGDFRSGKRLAMRKVIAYIASHFRKDKIWLRRTRPDQRTYQARACAACAWAIVPVAKFLGLSFGECCALVAACLRWARRTHTHPEYKASKLVLCVP